MKFSPGQIAILETDGHLLVTGGPGAGKTTIAILKAGQFAQKQLKPGQRVLFLSFARATVSRVLEAIEEEAALPHEVKIKIEVETYHSLFWQILKTHGYLLGLPRKLALLAPPAEAIALSPFRALYARASKLTPEQKAAKKKDEHDERVRLAFKEGRVAFDLFASYCAELLEKSKKIRGLIGNAYPFVVLDEFQDTNAEQWRFVRALGKCSTLAALADPEQRIFDFIGADPARIGQFKETFKPSEIDLKSENHRSPGTDIARFGNDILTSNFTFPYKGILVTGYEANPSQAWAAISGHTLAALKRLKKQRVDWSLAVLVPTKSLARAISDAFHSPPGGMPPIFHTAVMDMDGPILAAELIALLLQPAASDRDERIFAHHVAEFFLGKGGDAPTKGAMEEAKRIFAAAGKYEELKAQGRKLPGNSILAAIFATLVEIRDLKFVGAPDSDWLAVRAKLDKSECPRLREIGAEARYIRILEKGASFRQALALDWRTHGSYLNALEITRSAFAQEHFSTAQKPERGVTIMNMHKAKGKQFDEVIVFEGWPVIQKNKIIANPDRIVRGNETGAHMSQSRQNFRVSITRARNISAILTPKRNPCVLLPSLALFLK